MSDDMLVHFASNSSNQSDNSLNNRLAMLEARMVGKSSSVPAPPPVPAAVESQQQQSTRSSSSTMFAGINNGLQNESLSSDSDDTASEYLIQANTQKRRKYDEEGSDAVSKHVESAIDTPQKIADTADATRPASETNRKRQSRGRGQPSSGRGRGSRASEQSKSQIVPPSNGQSENFSEKEGWPKEQIRQNNFSQVEDENTALREKVAALEESLRKSQTLTQQLEKELKDIKDVEQHMKAKRMKALSDLLISVSKAEREEARRKVSQDSLRLGNVKVIRAGTIISETWEDGQALKDLNARLKNLLEVKEAMERQKKALKKRQPDKGDGTDSDTSMQEDLFYQDEMWKSRLAGIKREEEAILRKRDRYELKKARLIREMKRIRDEDDSRFNNFQILNHRYALLNLLGKGGFSEVYKAFDLLEYRYVACKLHGLNAQWSEEKKQSYIRHAIREYNIHKTLVHNNIVRLWDIFEIDNNTFCTVLEYCSEKDLDAVLKLTPNLPEKEARSIISEIFQGLVYLNKRSKKIIHYDLKPGNVLFDELKIPKMTDFGLSKILEDDVGSQGMELTSQGAGTYWYLPPECFELNKTPFISSKVDVWSAGVLYYQMLFGRRPFGHDQTQERILREDTIINARKVEFPSRPPVSNEAKEFIRRCLTYNQADRPDVLTIAQDPYVSFPKK